MPARRPCRHDRSITAAWVVTSRPVVGSSAISRRRLAGHRDGDHDPLAHAARELERVGAGAAVGIGDADRAQHLDRARLRASRRRQAGMAQHHIGDLLADGRIGFSAARGFWKIIDGAGGRGSPQRGGGGGGEVRPLAAPALPPVIRPAASSRPQQRIGGDRLAGAAFADQRQRLAAADAEGDAVQRLDDAATGCENSTEKSAISSTRASCASSSDRRCRARRRPAG